MKKLISFILCGCLVLGLSVTAFAEDAAPDGSDDTPILISAPVEDGKGGKLDENTLEKIILFVKGKITIPAELTEFDYYVYSYKDGVAENISLSWSDKKRTRTISVIYSSENILGYSDYKNDSGDIKIAKITREQGQEAAEAFAKNLVPSVGEYKKTAERAGGNNFEYTFTYHKNGLPVNGIYFVVRVDYTDKSIKDFYNVPNYAKEFLGDKANAISLEEATKIYKAGIKAELYYFTSYDYKDGKISTFPAYTVTSENSVIDAITGKPISYGTRDVGYDDGDKSDSNEAGAAPTDPGSDGLTESEAAAAEEYDNILKPEEAFAKLQEAVPEFFKDAKLTGNWLSRNYYDKETLTWELSMDQGDKRTYSYASVDAKTGEIMSFSCYDWNDNDYSKEYTVDNEKLKTAANAMVARLSKGDYKYSEISISESKGRFAYANFVRLENDIKTQDGISVSFDNVTGKICSYNKRITKAEYKKFTPAGDEAVKNEYVKHSPLELCYVSTDGTTFSLAYAAKVDYNVSYFDGITAKPINYDGKPYQPVPDDGFTYSDISGHYAEAQIKDLAGIGVGFSGGLFKPDQNITDTELAELLLSVSGGKYYITPEMIYDCIGMPMPAPGAETEGVVVTREKAAILMANILGYGNAAKLEGIYKQPFSDVTEDMEGFGAIAIIKGLKIVGGNGNDTFSPAAYLTRGQFAIMLYNLLANR